MVGERNLFWGQVVFNNLSKECCLATGQHNQMSSCQKQLFNSRIQLHVASLRLRRRSRRLAVAEQISLSSVMQLVEGAPIGCVQGGEGGDCDSGCSGSLQLGGSYLLLRCELISREECELSPVVWRPGRYLP